MVRRWGFLAILNQLSDLSLQFTDYWWVHLIFVNLSYLTAAEVITSRALGFMLQPNLRSPPTYSLSTHFIIHNS